MKDDSDDIVTVTVTARVMMSDDSRTKSKKKKKDKTTVRNYLRTHYYIRLFMYYTNRVLYLRNGQFFSP